MVYSQSRCLDKLNRVYQDSHCYTCSGRAKSFFEFDQLRLHENTCRNIIIQCSGAWTYLIDFFFKIDQFYQALDEADGSASKKKKSEHSPPVNPVTSWATENDIPNQLENCLDGLCSFNTASSLCDSFVTIGQPSYLRQSLKIMGKINRTGKRGRKQDQKLLKGIKDKIKKGLAQLKVYLESDENKGRLLLLTGLKSPNSSTATSLASAPRTPMAPSSQSASSTPETTYTSPPNSPTSKSPLLCVTAGSTDCISDKTVETDSQCGSKDTHLCTLPSVSLP